MHWPNSLLLPAAALCLTTWLAPPVNGGDGSLTLSRRQNDVRVEDETVNPNPRIVYRGDERSPLEIRDTGGFQPQGGNWSEYEEAFSIDRHYTAGQNGRGLDESDEDGFVFRTAYVSVSDSLETSSRYGHWIYEIIAAQNILNVLDAENEPRYPEGEMFALGGIHWRQIRRYAHITPGQPPAEADWQRNPEFNEDLYGNAIQAFVSTEFPMELEDGEVVDDESSSESSDDDEGNRADDARLPRRPLFISAMRHVEDRAAEFVGSLPFHFEHYPYTLLDIPGPPFVEEDMDYARSVDQFVDRELRLYTQYDRAQMDMFFPEAREVIDELNNPNTQQGACSALLNMGGRSAMKLKRRAASQSSKNACPKLVSKLRKLKVGHRVRLCKADSFNPPCIHVKTPLMAGQCTNVPAEYKKQVSSIRPEAKAGTCTFYKEPNCQDKSINVTWPGISLYDQFSPIKGFFNDAASSFSCDFVKVCGRGKAPEPWCTKPKQQFCDYVDKLTLQFQLVKDDLTGTKDTIVAFLSSKQCATLVVAEQPRDGYSVFINIDLPSIFNKEKVALSDINHIQLVDIPRAGHEGKKWWHMEGVTLGARCAGSQVMITMDKFNAERKWIGHDAPGPLPQLVWEKTFTPDLWKFAS
ncbi:hypothetical protein CP533_6049 [Ophiocordyceps camponoti-saundersi (nom. inval.)]|nr:hypothetical protein CP533_6049 [Ophiocordyceps camponoti-saundersi (nom. inval.)]